MNTSTTGIAAGLACLAIGSTGYATMMGAVATDRFGYTGTVVKYASLVDAQNGVNAIETIAIGNRDLALYIVNDYAAYDTDYNIIMGSWWYTTSDNTNGVPKDDPTGDRYYSGYGNTRGNTGVGFMQLYDNDGSTDSSMSMEFANYDGTHWTEFNMSITGGGGGVEDFARFSPFTSNTNDKGIYHSYNLTLTATGLEGLETAPGVIESFNHPTGVTGSYTGIFENTGNVSDVNDGFYVFDLTLDMDNWAFAQGDAALNGDFYDSYFATIPGPGSMGIFALAGLTAIRRKRA